MKKNTNIITFEKTNSGLPVFENRRISLREFAKGYDNKLGDEDGSVVSYPCGRKLIIHPEFQRAYVVGNNTAWRSNLILSVAQCCPINSIYIGVLPDGTWVVIDGQQRLTTILDWISGNAAYHVAIDGVESERMFSALPTGIRESILDYELDIKICEGTAEEQLRWFKTINQPTFMLTQQELRNATYGSPFVESLKRLFSTTGHGNRTTEYTSKESKYFVGHFCGLKKAERQEYLEQVLDWASLGYYAELIGLESACKMSADERIEGYMALHSQTDNNADAVVNYYKTMIEWVLDTFFKEYVPKSYQSLSKVEWSRLYLQYGKNVLTYEQKRYITKTCAELINNYKAFSSVSGVYEWVLRGEKEDDMQLLSLRGFSSMDKDKMYGLQGGIDPIDGQHYDMEDMHAHHIKSWRDKGVSDLENLVWLSKENHRKYHAGDFGISPQTLREMRDKVRKEQGNL